MAAVDGIIPSLIDGMSQQAAALRRPSQLEDLKNAWCSPVDGLMKRNGLEVMAEIDNTANMDVDHWSAHWIDGGEGHARQMFIYGDPNNAGEQYHLRSLVDGSALTLSEAAVTYLSSINSADIRESVRGHVVGETLVITNKNVVTGALAATAVSTWGGSVQTFSDLPASPAYDVYEVAGSAENSFKPYYVLYTGGIWREYWRETDGAQQHQFDPATMPKNISTTIGPTTRHLGNANWADRLVGDLTTTPFPSFHQSTIDFMFSWRGRVGYVSGSNIVLSRAGDNYNLYPSSAVTGLDDDPIDFSLADHDFGNINYVLPFAKQLLVFADRGQFLLSASGALTPTTITADATTRYTTSKAQPAALGSSAYFGSLNGEFTSLREYYVDANTVTESASDITSHVPKLLPKDLFIITEDQSTDTLFCVSATDHQTVYVCQQKWVGEEKVQVAWNRWDFPGLSINSMKVIDGWLYVLGVYGSKLYLMRMSMDPDVAESQLPFHVHLDFKARSSGTYDAGTDITTWTHTTDVDSNFVIVLDDTSGSDEGIVFSGSQITVSGTNDLEVAGDWSSGQAYIGRKTLFEATLSEIFHRDEDGNAREGRLTLNYLHVRYEDSGYFEVEVTPGNRAARTYVNNMRTLGGNWLLGSNPILSGTSRVPIFTASKDATIKLTSESPLPCRFLTAEWSGKFLPQQGGR